MCIQVFQLLGATSPTLNIIMIMADRASHFSITRDFNRSYLDSVDKHKQWMMEEWIRFVEAWSPTSLLTTLNVAAKSCVTFACARCGLSCVRQRCTIIECCEKGSLISKDERQGG